MQVIHAKMQNALMALWAALIIAAVAVVHLRNNHHKATLIRFVEQEQKPVELAHHDPKWDHVMGQVEARLEQLIERGF